MLNMNDIIEIDEIDKRILFELERNARTADVTLAKIVKKSKDAVRYRIKNLEESGVITGYKTWIDFAKLGYRSDTLYITLLNLPEKKKRLIEEIMNNPRTYWIGVAEGTWNIGVTFFIKNNEELLKIKNDLMSKYEEIILDCKVTSLVSVSVHEKNFLVDEETKLTSFTQNVENTPIDDVAKKILRELYWNSKENVATIAYNLDTTVDIVRNRIKNLENDRIIIRYSAAIDYQKIGYEFHKAFIYLKKVDEEFDLKFKNYIQNSKIVINMVKQIAPWDIEIVLFTRNFSEYDKTIAEITKLFSKNIKKIESATMSTDIIFPCKKLLG